jgi:hypothetical protein
MGQKFHQFRKNTNQKKNYKKSRFIIILFTFLRVI